MIMGLFYDDPATRFRGASSSAAPANISYSGRSPKPLVAQRHDARRAAIRRLVAADDRLGHQDTSHVTQGQAERPPRQTV
jgi:hypothetical protein